MVKGLVDGTKYKFRVKAQNIYGTSEPATTDKSTLAKNPFGGLLDFNHIINKLCQLNLQVLIMLESLILLFMIDHVVR